MFPFAETPLVPDALLAWVVVGLLAGLLAGEAMRSRYGLIRDMAVGLAGAVAAGFLFGMVFSGTAGFVGGVMVAFLGACVLIAILRGLTTRAPRT